MPINNVTIKSPEVEQAADMGRGGDTEMAHVTPGEVVIPLNVQTPELMSALKQAFDQAGVSIEQYTVGESENSINPETGAPEYGLGSFLKKAAGAVIPAAMSYMTGGTSAALMSGANTLLGGLSSGSSGGSAGGGGAPTTSKTFMDIIKENRSLPENQIVQRNTPQLNVSSASSIPDASANSGMINGAMTPPLATTGRGNVNPAAYSMNAVNPQTGYKEFAATANSWDLINHVSSQGLLKPEQVAKIYEGSGITKALGPNPTPQALRDYMTANPTINNNILGYVKTNFGFGPGKQTLDTPAAQTPAAQASAPKGATIVNYIPNNGIGHSRGQGSYVLSDGTVVSAADVQKQLYPGQGVQKNWNNSTEGATSANYIGKMYNGTSQTKPAETQTTAPGTTGTGTTTNTNPIVSAKPGATGGTGTGGSTGGAAVPDWKADMDKMYKDLEAKYNSLLSGQNTNTGTTGTTGTGTTTTGGTSTGTGGTTPNTIAEQPGTVRISSLTPIRSRRFRSSNYVGGNARNF